MWFRDKAIFVHLVLITKGEIKVEKVGGRVGQLSIHVLVSLVPWGQGRNTIIWDLCLGWTFWNQHLWTCHKCLREKCPPPHKKKEKKWAEFMHPQIVVLCSDNIDDKEKKWKTKLILKERSTRKWNRSTQWTGKENKNGRRTESHYRFKSTVGQSGMLIWYS